MQQILGIALTAGLFGTALIFALAPVINQVVNQMTNQVVNQVTRGRHHAEDLHGDGR